MPALDRNHVIVRNALEKDGWTITHDPLTMMVDDRRVHIDLGAEKLLLAEKENQQIAVEIKMFTGASKIHDLEQALGQYMLYRIFLRHKHPERKLYLAIPQDVIDDLFREVTGDAFLTEEGGLIFGFDAQKEEITEWLP
jgi:hypothetical protein